MLTILDQHFNTVNGVTMGLGVSLGQNRKIRFMKYFIIFQNPALVINYIYLVIPCNDIIGVNAMNFNLDLEF